MTRIGSDWIALLTCVAWLAPVALGCFSALAATPPPGVRHVVIVGVDGMSPDGVVVARTPHLDRLMRQGAYSMRARAVLPTSSGPNWASMIMAAQPEQHGVTSNDWRRDQRSIEPQQTGLDPALFPTIFGVLRQQRPDAYIASIYDWSGFGRLYEREAVDFDRDAAGPDDAVRGAVEQFASRRPTFTFIHLDHVDHAGHAHGHGTIQYYESVAHADVLIGRVLEGLDRAGMAEQTLVIVTSDHGGIGNGHGGESMDELEVPWIIRGPGVAAGRRLASAICLTDTAATAAWALGLNPPQAWRGRPVTEAFTPPASTDGDEHAAAPAPYVPRPTIHPEGRLFVAEKPVVRIDPKLDRLAVHYTLDGSTPTLASPRYTRPFMLNESATVKARAFGGEAASRVSEQAYRLTDRVDGRGVRYRYFEGQWDRLPDFDAMTPVRRGHALEFTLEGIDHAGDAFGLCFEGVLLVETPGRYTFFTASDDGSRLYLGDRLVVDNDGDHGVIEKSGSIELEAGRHPIRVEYFEAGGGEELSVFYRGPGIEKRVIPFERLEPR